ESEVGSDLPAVAGDQALIRRALVNLVDNAIKFSPDNSEVLLSAEHDQDGIRFAVSDRGPGVPDAFRKKIFEKYVQIPGQKGRRKGTGLGLALARLVGEAHHGRLWVDPRTGGGSVFSMFIPGGVE